MSSGRIHDRIALWSLPFVAGLTFRHTHSSHLTLFVSGGFLFSGLMFGPDLDTYSRQFQRWGCLSWMWMPYRNSVNHRSFLSHGPFIGTAVRLIYLTTWIGFLLIPSFILSQLWGPKLSFFTFIEILWRSLSPHYTEAWALFIGLELGAMTHSLTDVSSSAYKRFKTKGWVGLIPQSTYKRFQSQGWSGLIPEISQPKKRRSKSVAIQKSKAKTQISKF